MNNDSFYQRERFQEQYGRQDSIGSYTAKTFLWMFFGLLTTFFIALLGYTSRLTLYALISIPYFHLIVLVAEVAVVLILSSRIERLSLLTARLLFFAYAAMTGVVFSTYFLLFEMSSLILIFAATAVYFAALALYGYFTKADLSRLRPILITGLIFLVIFGVLSLFLPFSGSMDRIICLAGIAIFLGFTAYDTQKIRAYHAYYGHDPVMAQKASIIAALQLYLDFINLFLYLLRFMGKQKN